ncbi:MAG: DUF4405 domain-containing protein, partial [Bacteroidetes bacterium]|nr:DUF4405 domain-containing protein [Bacteroidota bacterium]
MSKSKINFLIDSLMFLCMAAIAGIGLLMKYVLIPGQDRWIKYGKNVEIYVFNMDRHEWGTIHLVIALVLLGLLSLHFILHWKLIVGLFSKLINNRSIRKPIAIVFLFISVFLFLFAFFVKPEIGEIIQGQGRQVTDKIIISETEITDIHDNEAVIKDDNFIEKDSKEKETKENDDKSEAVKDNGKGTLQDAEESHERHNRSNKDIEIRGYMTIREVSVKYDVPSNYIKKKLNIPETVSDNQNLGLLRREYGFRMSDIEKIIN